MLMLHSAVKLRPFELTVGECGVCGGAGSVVWGGGGEYGVCVGGRGVWCVCGGVGSVVCVWGGGECCVLGGGPRDTLTFM